VAVIEIRRAEVLDAAKRDERYQANLPTTP
jgi:hypothetical protein